MAAKKKEKADDAAAQNLSFDDQGRVKALEAALSDLTKRFGDGTIVRLGDAAHLAVEVIPSGSLTTDIALGVGGIPRGRITEIYGPESSGKTTLCLHVIAEAQKRGGLCAFVDMEHALDPAYAERIGVNVDTLYVSQPDTGEQALEITEALVRSGALDVVVVDSVAALVPRAEIEGEMGDAFVGLQARLMSQALRKLSGAIKHSNVAVLFTNQLREKVGVMFGCFHYSARVVLADGTTEKIGKIVNQKMDVEVLSYNVKTREFEPRRIANWFDNGNAERFLQFIVDSNERRGRREFGVTPNHMLLTPDGYRPAGDLNVGDELVTSVKFYLTPLHEQVVLGSALGDGSLRYVSDYNVQLHIGHGAKQTEYCKWKESLFGSLVKYHATNSKGGHSFDTIPMYELAKIYTESYQDGKKHPADSLIERLSPLAIAIWYMDDGTLYGGLTRHGKPRHPRAAICVKRLEVERRERLQQWFTERGMEVGLAQNGNLIFTRKGTYVLHEMIAQYVHPSMDYKLLPEFRGQFKPLFADPCERLQSVPMPILRIHEKPRTRSMRRFDIEVEGNHCYVVDGVVVHNSPETTSGGRALKFYASVRLDIRRIQSIKQGGESIGNRVKVRVTKNKVAAPFREAEFDMMFYEGGISKVGEIVDLGVELGIIDKRGAFFRYNDGLLGQGRESAKQFLLQNPAVSNEIEQAIRLHFGLPPIS
ncbi:MAG: recombinase RecA [Chloroflexi bacterium]|nr:recombinase RecA [Chloroflexota bacterium]MDL1883108.1 recombinase RecA [Anaerolineae bacterium CFX8]